MTFWDTILGNQLAKTLIRELPKLTKQKKQYSVTIPNNKVHEVLEDKIKAGERYVGHFSCGDKTTIIMEKE